MSRWHASAGLAKLIVGLAVGLAIGLLLGLVVIDDEDDAPLGVLSVPTLENVIENPGRYAGKTVVVSGEVREILGPRTFIVGGNEFIGGDELIVVSKGAVNARIDDDQGSDRPLLENDIVTVRGKIERFGSPGFDDQIDSELEREFDVFPADDLRERRGQTTMIAEEVDVLPRVFPIRDASSIDEVLQRPNDFVGNVVSLGGEITAVKGDDGFVLDDKLLMLAATGTKTIPARGTRVRVVGPVRLVDPDQLERTRPDIDIEPFGELDNRPAVVAEPIEVSEEASAG
jgi:hypothetical protein